MALVQLGSAVPNLEVAHLALDRARVEVTSAADAPAAGDLGKQGGTPAWQPLRGEGPRPAASFV